MEIQLLTPFIVAVDMVHYQLMSCQVVLPNVHVILLKSF